DRGVIAHARAVTGLALLFSENSVVDRDLVRAGAMLHDIGRGMTHGIDHAQRGADLARSLGVPPAVASIIERHIGAGMTADECTLEGLLARDCMPGTLEEKIVANADNLVQGDRPGSIDAILAGSIRLKKRVRRRMCRLSLEMEGLR
ncbi:MAG: HDIG domain-containing protein, partial [Methanomicrobiales archaeon]|nr:HDIG domain-containing protein [Methanomicrobiales archaeon]